MVDSSAYSTQVADIVAFRMAELLHSPVHSSHVKIDTPQDDLNSSLCAPSTPTEYSLIALLQILLERGFPTDEVTLKDCFSREAISIQIVDALLEMIANHTVSQAATQYELKNQLIQDLLRGPVNSVTLNRAKQLGIDLTQPRAVILIDASEYILRDTAFKDSPTFQDGPAFKDSHRPDQPQINSAPQQAQAVIRSIVSFFHLPNDAICADLGDGYVCVLKASNTKNLDPWASRTDVAEELGTSWANLSALKRAADALLNRLRNDTGTAISIGIGRYHPGFQGLARSYEDARVALSLGNRVRGGNQVHCLGEMGIAAFIGIADEETKIDLAKYLLSPLDQETELLTTLDTFFSEDCCPSSTAKRLSIHRNTLSYRLDKISSLTGLEPRKFDDAVQMRLSLLLRSLQAGSL
jgi:carbohydrate diacid regulator